jgi:pimeloyl-ACP methyl ester carboxylesterase
MHPRTDLLKEAHMRNLNSDKSGTTTSARPVRDRKALWASLAWLGMALCMVPATRLHSQAATASREARTTLHRSKNMTALDTMDAPRTMPATGTPNEDTSIRPFRFIASEEALTDLRRRIQATRWPSKETVGDRSQGVQLEVVQNIARYWGTDYDWRKVEAKLNSYPQFITSIDGLDIHFIHVKSKEKNALPIIITHGWPGSILEQLKIIDPLTNPTMYGGSASDAFDVVIPSMAGYGFSGQPTSPGWGAERMARAWTELMKRLGYTRYVAQGGDWGGLIVDQMGVQAAPGLLAIHTNFPGAVPGNVDQAAATGAAPPAGLSADEKQAFDRIALFYRTNLAMYLEMGNRPQTLYGIEDSPIGLAAWMLDHDDRSQQLIASAFAGTEGGLTRDDILDNLTLFWLTNTAVSASRLYWENKLPFFGPKGVKIPVAVSVFPDEIYAAPRNWVEKAYPNLIHYNKVAKGGHFAAWEQPELLTAELRAAFKPLRTTASGAR